MPTFGLNDEEDDEMTEHRRQSVSASTADERAQLSSNSTQSSRRAHELNAETTEGERLLNKQFDSIPLDDMVHYRHPNGDVKTADGLRPRSTLSTEHEQEESHRRRETLKKRHANMTHYQTILQKKCPSCFMLDGHRKIDFILAFDSPQVTLKKADEDDRRKIEESMARRAVFEMNLEEQGLVLERQSVDMSQDNMSEYVKVHAPWEVLAKQAEILALRMPVGVVTMEKTNFTKFAEAIDNINLLKLDNIGQDLADEDYFTAPFNVERQSQFLITDEDTFFTNADRSRMVYDILIRAPWEPDEVDEELKQDVGIDRLLSKGIYSAAFPLHEEDWKEHPSSTRLDEEGEKGPPSDREMLYRTWAKWTRAFKYQPMDLIKKYYGSKISLYFAWLGFYTTTLWPPAALGVMATIYGAMTLLTDAPSLEVCDPLGAGNTTMCPVCDYDSPACTMWKLYDSCLMSRITHLSDNWFTVFFAFAMSIWASLFLEGWKRYRYELAWKWNTISASLFDAEEDRVRPEYDTHIRSREIRHKRLAHRLNAITDRKEATIPFLERILRQSSSLVAALFFLSLVIALIVGIIVYRLASTYWLLALGKKTEDGKGGGGTVSDDQVEMIRKYYGLIVGMTAACLNLIAIILLSQVYNKMALKLTEWEYPRTEREFENSYTVKAYCFAFINYYSSLFYIAFLKGKFTPIPGMDASQNYHVFGYNLEQCSTSGCMTELVTQLAIIMIGKQIINNIQEICFPILSNMWRHWKLRKTLVDRPDNPYTQWERDHSLNFVPDRCLHPEYMEMVLQYGFVTLFVSAFPLAPFFAVLNNIIEIRLDAYKFVVTYRRPMAATAVDLGVWRSILDVISKMAVITNACVIAFTSEWIPKLVFQTVYNPNHTLDGYVDFSLSYFNTSQLGETYPDAYAEAQYCRYKSYRLPACLTNVNPKYYTDCDDSDARYSMLWWHVMCAKFAFVLVFVLVVFAVKGIIEHAIPDMPNSIKMKMQREDYLSRQAFAEYGKTHSHLYKSRAGRQPTELDRDTESYHTSVETPSGITSLSSGLNRTSTLELYDVRHKESNSPLKM